MSNDNVFIGYQAGMNTTTGSNNIGIGYQAIRPGNCLCCNELSMLSDRGLCDNCDKEIPYYIPKEQYITYMEKRKK